MYRSLPEVVRVAEEVINGRGKRSRKRKTAAQEAEEPEPEPEVARTIDVPVWEGTSCADDMRYRFLFPLVRIWFSEAGNRIQLMFVAFLAQ